MPKRGENIKKRKDVKLEGRFIKGRKSIDKTIYSSVNRRTCIIVKNKLKSNEQYHKIHPCGEKSFRDALYLWLESNKIKQKSQTYYKYLHIIDSHIVPLIGNIPLSELNYFIINQFITEKSNSGRLDRKGGLSSSYIQTMCFIISSTLSFCEENVFCSPIPGKMIRPAKQKKDIRVLSLDEQKQLEKTLFTGINETKTGMLLSLYAGLRVGEVCGLRWENIDLKNDIIHIENSVERIKNTDKNPSSSKTVLILSNTKSEASNRIIPIPVILKPILEKNKKNNNCFILEGKTHPFADPRTLQYAFKKCLIDCALPNINYHALRHTFATRCIEAGVDVKSLSEILGHSDVNITLNTYVHSSIEQKRLQMEKLNSYCGQ